MSTPQERLSWISYYEREGCLKADVCRRFKISRPTFDKWLKRWRRGHQIRSLEEKPRTPKRSTRMLSPELQVYIRFLRGQLSKRKALELISGEGEKVRISKRRLSRFKLNPHLLNEIYLMGRPSLRNKTSYRKIQRILWDEWLIQRDGKLPSIRRISSYRDIQENLQEKWLIPRDGKVPSIHAIANACSRRGKKYRRNRKSTRGPV